MVGLQDLPTETLFSIFREVMPRDLGRLCRTCREFENMITSNYLLYRDVYLQRWDTPSDRSMRPAEHWKADLETFTKLLNILESDNILAKTQTSEMAFVAPAMDKFLAASSLGKDGLSINVATLVEQFEYGLNRTVFLFRSSTFDRARRPHQRQLRSAAEKAHIHQLSAKMNCIYGTPSSRTYGQEGVQVYPYAASKVYALRNYSQSAMWGPFKQDGSFEVDWEKLEAVMIVLGENIEHRRVNYPGVDWDVWTEPFRGAFPHSYQPINPPGHVRSLDHIQQLHTMSCKASAPGDPYGVNGYWMRIVCFVDYHEFFAYNFDYDNPPPTEPLPPLNTEEATRLLIMAIEVTEIEDPGPDDGQDLPVVHFKGVAKPMTDFWGYGPHIIMRGSVRQTKEGEIRWTTFSVLEGEERWRSEGIQIGGLHSGRGVFGHWFDKNCDPQGPIGPTAFWKIHDLTENEDTKKPES